jgi:hypothetical protein
MSRAEQTWKEMAARLAVGRAPDPDRHGGLPYLVEALKAGAERRQWPPPLVGAIGPGKGQSWDQLVERLVQGAKARVLAA